MTVNKLFFEYKDSCKYLNIEKESGDGYFMQMPKQELQEKFKNLKVKYYCVISQTLHITV